jgi:hypothetical protein
MINEALLIEQLKGYKSKWKLAEPFHEGIANGLQIAIEATQRQPKVEWIPCSERLPKIDGEYLCWFKGSIYACACVRKFAKDLYLIDKFEFNKESGAGFYYYESDWGYFKEKDVIAWMPLPPAYKE